MTIKGSYSRQYLRLEETVGYIADQIGVNNLERYFVPLRQWDDKSPNTPDNRFKESKELKAEDMMEQFAISLQNSWQMRNSIKLGDGESKDRETAGKKFIRKITEGFNPETISKWNSYDALHQALLDYEHYKPSERSNHAKGQTNLEKYAQGLYEAAQYLHSEAALERINEAICTPCSGEWPKTVENLPNEIQGKIRGLGPALARDFLKECGCLWLAKPDVHLIRVFEGLGIIEATTQDYIDERRAQEFSREMYEFSRIVREETGDETATPFKIDRMIWLLCTGDFYLEDDPAVRGHRDLLVRSLRNA